MQYIANVVVRPKPGILDPQSKAVLSTLTRIGYRSVTGFVQAKYSIVTLEAEDEAAALLLVKEMLDKILYNRVMEVYEIVSLLPAPPG